MLDSSSRGFIFIVSRQGSSFEGRGNGPNFESCSQPGPSGLQPQRPPQPGPSGLQPQRPPQPGPSGLQPQSGPPLTLQEELRLAKAARARDARNMSRLTPTQKQALAVLKDKKQVGNYLLPTGDLAPKGKKKGIEGRCWHPALLLPGTPSVPPPPNPRYWEKSSQAVVETQTASHLRIDDVSGCREEDSAIASTTEAPPSAVTPDDATDDEDVIEGTPPRPILIRRRARAVSPQSHALGRANESPLEKMMKIISNPPSVAQEVELGGTPSSTITMKTGSGTSGVSYNFDIGVDLEAVEETEEEALAGTERAYPDDSVAFIVNVPVADKNYMLVDCPANVAIDAPAHQGEDVTVGDSANAGSDIEPDDDEPHGPLRRRDVHEYDEVEGNPFLEDQVQVMNAADDAFLRTAPDNAELLHFDWSSEVDNFEGVREIFSGPSGPTFDLEGLTPLDVFRQIWDTNILSLMVRETNRYAQHIIDGLPTSSSSRMNRWVDTDEEEMWRFLCILMLQSLVYTPVEREYWYPIQESVKLGCDDIMPYNRFILLKRCLHFVDNTTLDPVSTSKLQKVMPIIQHLNHKFGSLYLPEQNVAIDESLLLWKGRLSFAQLIATKRARVGIKSYELCESRTGYLWKMEIYTGSGHIHEPQEATQAAAGHDVENEPESATSQIVFSLMRPLFGKGHTLVMDNFYNSPLLSRILKLKYKTDTVGTLRLKREYVPESLKGKTKQNMRTGEICFSSTKDLCIVVWMDSNVVSMISTCHGVKSGGKEKYGYYKYKPEVVLYYNNTMGGIDHKDQMLSSYPIERVRNVIWYKKLFRRLLNVSVHNSFVIYTHGNEMKYRHFRNTIVTQLRAAYQHPAPSRALVVRPSGQRAAMHLPQKIKKLRCKLCYAAKKTRSTVWQCSTCLVALCLPDCYKEYHDKLCTE
ncbi:piggyBac transposable element-derived protein 4 isoform X5 [Spodoptera frugiperda]|uniref:PiggyBac transposable element-derived protein 4 isoform X5 n=1 Tax=Spodoptera frugiperda TaxID=7108 RepID=A0A9R0DRI3_SPOFR|nr:piggyBac transposable element-derived protein 4 isoform X5 [Spodoptera frugiperda]XP_050552247.1 piggyBac transposable element-derived protein 4 isoform X5 [Spodoptera frugiperda]